jgi:hypothetical protein
MDGGAENGQDRHSWATKSRLKRMTTLQTHSRQQSVPPSLVATSPTRTPDTASMHSPVVLCLTIMALCATLASANTCPPSFFGPASAYNVFLLGSSSPNASTTTSPFTFDLADGGVVEGTCSPSTRLVRDECALANMISLDHQDEWQPLGASAPRT